MSDSNINRLGKLGTFRRVEIVSHEIMKRMPALRLVCDLVKEHVFVPYQRGDDAIPFNAGAARGKQTLYEAIQAALGLEKEDD